MSAARVDEPLPLGLGSCHLDAAVPEESPFLTIEDLAGATVAMRAIDFRMS